MTSNDLIDEKPIKPENPSAFPNDFGGSAYAPEFGMSLRDYFASKALSGWVKGMPCSIKDMAQGCYEIADAMLEARGK